MFAVRAAFLLGLARLTCSAPMSCGDLLRPLDGLQPASLAGDWALVAGSVSHPPLMEHFRQRDSATTSFRNTADSGAIAMKRSMRFENQCHYMSFNISLEGSSFTVNHGRVNATFVRTSCPDCLLISFDVESGTRVHFYLFAKRRQLEEEEMEEFRRQVTCLKMPPPVVMDPAKELCPEEGSSQATVEGKTET